MARKSTDRDMFDLDALVAEESGEPFRFRAGGKEWELPPYGSLDWQVLEYSDGNDLAFTRAALRVGLGEQWPAFDAIRGLGVTAVSVLVERWVAHSGVVPGESQASSDS